MIHLTSRYLASKRSLWLLLACLALLILLLSGCGRSATRRTLLHAESIMEAHPDSAYALLSALCVDSAAPEEDRALFALLLTQAMYKLDILGISPKETIDSHGRMMDNAIGYFEKENDRKQTMESYYYRGVVMMCYPDSLPYSLQPFSISLDLAREQKDTFYIAKSYSMLSAIYGQGKAYHDQAEAEKIALDYFKVTGRENFINYSRFTLGSALFASGKHEEALARIDTLLSDLPQNEVTSLKVRALNIKARALYYCERYPDAISMIEYLDSIDQHQPDLTLFHAASYIERDDIPIAKKLMEAQAEDLDSIDSNILENILYQKSRDVSEELQAMYTLYDGLTEDYNEITQGNLNTIQSFAQRNAADRHHHEREVMRLQIVIVGMVLLLLALAFGMLYFRFIRNKKKLSATGKELDVTRAELERILSDFQKKEEELEEMSRIEEKMEQDINEIIDKYGAGIPDSDLRTDIKERLSSLIDYLKQLNEREISMTKWKMREVSLSYIHSVSRIISDICMRDRTVGDKKGRIVDEIESLKEYLDSFKVNSDAMPIREKLIDELTDNDISKLRTGAAGRPKLREDYVLFALYLFYGFDSDTISELFKKEKNSLYSLKKRLNEKLKNLPEAQKERYEYVLARQNGRK